MIVFVAELLSSSAYECSVSSSVHLINPQRQSLAAPVHEPFLQRTLETEQLEQLHSSLLKEIDLRGNPANLRPTLGNSESKQLCKRMTSQTLICNEYHMCRVTPLVTPIKVSF